LTRPPVGGAAEPARVGGSALGARSPCACPLCGAEALPALRVRDYEYGVPGEWVVARCTQCRLCFQAPLPDSACIPSFYPPTYSAYDADPATAWLFKLHYWLDARRVSKLIGPSGRVLDVGCGAGAGLLALRRHGDWELFGLEADDAAAQKARASGLNVEAGDLTTFSRPAAAFDLIRMGHVIEHVLDPAGTFRRAWQLLRPGGVLFGETPNTDCLDFRFFGRYWGALHVPRHIILFDHSNLVAALSRAGFRDVTLVRRLRTVGWSAGIQNWLADRFSLRVPPHGRVRWYPFLIALCLPLTITQSVLAWPATVAFTARKPA